MYVCIYIYIYYIYIYIDVYIYTYIYIYIYLFIRYLLHWLQQRYAWSSKHGKMAAFWYRLLRYEIPGKWSQPPAIAFRNVKERSLWYCRIVASFGRPTQAKTYVLCTTLYCIYLHAMHLSVQGHQRIACKSPLFCWSDDWLTSTCVPSCTQVSFKFCIAPPRDTTVILFITMSKGAFSTMKNIATLGGQKSEGVITAGPMQIDKKTKEAKGAQDAKVTDEAGRAGLLDTQLVFQQAT